jgi:hypothetical protein
MGASDPGIDLTGFRRGSGVSLYTSPRRSNRGLPAASMAAHQSEALVVRPSNDLVGLAKKGR